MAKARKTAARLSGDEIAHVVACDALTDEERSLLSAFYGLGEEPKTDVGIAKVLRWHEETVRRRRYAAQNKLRGWIAGVASTQEAQ